MKTRIARYMFIIGIIPAIAVTVYGISFFITPVRITAHIVPHRVTLGDPVTYTVTVLHNADIRADLQNAGENLKGFDLIGQGAQSYGLPGKKIDRYSFSLIRLSPGTYEVSPATVRLTRPDNSSATMDSNKVSITVKSSIKDPVVFKDTVSVSDSRAGEGGGAIRTIDVPISFKINEGTGPRPVITRFERTVFVAGISAVILFALTGLIVYRRSRYRKPPPVTPYESACRALQSLSERVMNTEYPLREIIFAVSDIVKEYLRSIVFRARRELSDHEFMTAIINAPTLLPDEKAFLKGLFSRYHYVKFSGETPERNIVAADIDGVKAVIRAINDRKG
ncbi:MAG: BatD family protein [Candidatus Omnitrophica bacterium]|nr:BatD family protein [Candidatus Omnitrophota bacterium]